MNLRDRAEFKVGQEGEKRVDAWLQSRGWFTIRSMEFTGDDKPPSMFGPDGKSLVLPDLDAAKDGSRRWVEVKTKTNADWSRNHKIFVHGISQRLFDHYREVSKITGTDVWMAVFEKKSGDLLALKIAGADRVCPAYSYDGPRMGRHGMVFFDRAKMSLLANLATST